MKIKAICLHCKTLLSERRRWQYFCGNECRDKGAVSINKIFDKVEDEWEKEDNETERSMDE